MIINGLLGYILYEYAERVFKKTFFARYWLTGLHIMCMVSHLLSV